MLLSLRSLIILYYCVCISGQIMLVLDTIGLISPFNFGVGEEEH